MRSLLMASALVLSACATLPNIRTDFDPTIDFASYRTYSWAPSRVPVGMNPLLFQRVRSSIDRSLFSRGYRQANSSDFVIDLTVVEREKIELNEAFTYSPAFGLGWAPRGGWVPWAWEGGFYPSLYLSQYIQQSIVIDIYDGSGRRPVWHGVVKKNGRLDHLDQVRLNRHVDAVLAKFPPSPSPR